MTDKIVWMMSSDLCPLARIQDDGTKHLMNLAELMCDIARTAGVTEVRVIDHDVLPLHKDS